MNKDLKYTQEIENYLSGELNAEKSAEFEKRLKEDKDLQDEFILTKKVINGIKGYAFKNMLKDIHQELFDAER